MKSFNVRYRCRLGTLVAIPYWKMSNTIIPRLPAKPPSVVPERDSSGPIEGSVGKIYDWVPMCKFNEVWSFNNGEVWMGLGARKVQCRMSTAYLG